jgi:hypothetical protein
MKQTRMPNKASRIYLTDAGFVLDTNTWRATPMGAGA